MNFPRISPNLIFETLAGFVQTSAILITSLLGSFFLLDTGPWGYGSGCVVLAFAIGFMLDFTILTGLVLTGGSFATSMMLILSSKDSLSAANETGSAVLFLVFVMFGIRQRLASVRLEDMAIAKSQISSS